MTQMSQMTYLENVEELFLALKLGDFISFILLESISKFSPGLNSLTVFK